MFIRGLFITTAALYGVASALYLAYLFRGRDGLGKLTNGALGAAVVANVVFLVADFAETGHHPASDMRGVLAALALATVVGFLFATLRKPVTVLGAFVTPLTLLFFLASGLGRTVEHVSPQVRSALLPVHIGVNILGVSAFALAFGAALAYVLQERMLRRKQLSGVFRRLPALDVLDSFGFRAVLVGFPLLTIGVVTGTLWIVRSHGAISFGIGQALGVVSWCVFAAVLLLRVIAGWQGRRAAVGTIMGFACAVAVLAFYALRSGVTL